MDANKKKTGSKEIKRDKQWCPLMKLGIVKRGSEQEEVEGAEILFFLFSAPSAFPPVKKTCSSPVELACFLFIL